MTDSGRLVLVIEQIALLRPLDTLRMRLACPHRRAIVRSPPYNNRQLSACRRDACRARNHDRIPRASLVGSIVKQPLFGVLSVTCFRGRRHQ